MGKADRLREIPAYIFARIDEIIQKKRLEGRDVISLGIGDPDLPTPQVVVEELCKAANDPANHRYPSYYGLRELREAITEWFLRRFGVKLDPDENVLPVIGSKDGISHLPWAFVNPGDYCLVPDPGYIVYRTSTILSGGRPFPMPLLPENAFLADFEVVGSRIASNAKVMFLNYPNNPTAAAADLGYLRRAFEFAEKYDILICYDNAYSEITFDGYVAPSMLQVEGAIERTIEFHSFSKSFNMTGWRIGFAVGGKELISVLGDLKSNIDSGIFNAIQRAAIRALRDAAESTREACRIYERRRDFVLEQLAGMSIDFFRPKGTLYVWARVPEGYTSASFCERVVSECDVVLTPGSAFGDYGEGFFRISLTVPDEVLKEAFERLSMLRF